MVQQRNIKTVTTMQQRHENELLGIILYTSILPTQQTNHRTAGQ